LCILNGWNICTLQGGISHRNWSSSSDRYSRHSFWIAFAFFIK
jgi:hypothetical protein